MHTVSTNFGQTFRRLNVHTADFHYGGHSGRHPVDGPMRVDQYQTGVGREHVQRHVHAKMFFQRPLAPRPVHVEEQGVGQVCVQRVGHALAEVHAVRQAAEHGWPVRDLRRLAEQRHGPWRHRAAGK